MKKNSNPLTAQRRAGEPCNDGRSSATRNPARQSELPEAPLSSNIHQVPVLGTSFQGTGNPTISEAWKERHLFSS